jgi:hypothetical protein
MTEWGPLPEDEFIAFTQRCHDATAAVQADLDRTGLPDIRLLLRMEQDAPGVGSCGYVGVLDGDVRGEFGGEELRPGMDEIELRQMAATNAIGALLIVEHLRWPRCVTHPTKYMVGWKPGGYGQAPDHPGWWWCNTVTATSAPHPVSSIGGLQPKQVAPFTRPRR